MVTTKEKSSGGLVYLRSPQSSTSYEAFQFHIEKDLYLYIWIVDDSFSFEGSILYNFINFPRLILGNKIRQGDFVSSAFNKFPFDPIHLTQEQLNLLVLRDLQL